MNGRNHATNQLGAAATAGACVLTRSKPPCAVATYQDICSYFREGACGLVRRLVGRTLGVERRAAHLGQPARSSSTNSSNCSISFFCGDATPFQPGISRSTRVLFMRSGFDP